MSDVFVQEVCLGGNGELVFRGLRRRLVQLGRCSTPLLRLPAASQVSDAVAKEAGADSCFTVQRLDPTRRGIITAGTIVVEQGGERLLSLSPSVPDDLRHHSPTPSTRRRPPQPPVPQSQPCRPRRQEAEEGRNGALQGIAQQAVDTTTDDVLAGRSRAPCAVRCRLPDFRLAADAEAGEAQTGTVACTCVPCSARFRGWRSLQSTARQRQHAKCARGTCKRVCQRRSYGQLGCGLMPQAQASGSEAGASGRPGRRRS